GNGVVLGSRATVSSGVRVGDDVWVGDGARVGDDVWVGDGVRLGEGVVLGNGVRLGNGVTVGNGVWLSEKTEWQTSPLQIQGSEHLIYHAGPGMVGVGCQVLEIGEWRAGAVTLAEEHGYSLEQVEEYLRYLQWMKDEDVRRFGGAV
ncbi:MAG: hypothetical protein KGJ58_04775, partial [Patescibacteria group bacterium]|nr:hypothetical protein [Patescibacteria group bacterium]